MIVHSKKVSMMEDDEQKKTSKQTGRGSDFEALHEKLTSEKVKKASDALFAASEEDLKKAFKPESD